MEEITINKFKWKKKIITVQLTKSIELSSSKSCYDTNSS